MRVAAPDVVETERSGMAWDAKALIRLNHYTHSFPSGKSHCVYVEGAVVVWSIPANKNIGSFLTREVGMVVWELSRLWAPDGHRDNLLTFAISRAVREIKRLENPDLLVSYADPNQGHRGGVYRAASWIFDGQSKEGRVYIDEFGNAVPRRSFRSNGKGLKKAQIEARGFREELRPGKLRFVKLLSKRAKAAYALRQLRDGGRAGEMMRGKVD